MLGGTPVRDSAWGVIYRLEIKIDTHKYEKWMYPAPMILEQLIGKLFGNVHFDRGIADGKILPLPLCLRIHDK
jgi:hypothetical protein